MPYSFVFFKGMPKWLLRGYLLSYCVTMHFLLAEKQSALLGSINFHSYTHIIWSRCLLMFYLNNWLVHEVKFAAGQCHKGQMTRSWRSKHHNINFLFYYTWDGTEMRCRSYQSLRIPYDDLVFLRAGMFPKSCFTSCFTTIYVRSFFDMLPVSIFLCGTFRCTCVHLYPLLGLPLYPWQDDDEDSVLQGVSPIVWRVGTLQEAAPWLWYTAA